jgi:hypothetical protein
MLSKTAFWPFFSKFQINFVSASWKNFPLVAALIASLGNRSFFFANSLSGFAAFACSWIKCDKIVQYPIAARLGARSFMALNSSSSVASFVSVTRGRYSSNIV